MRGRPNCRQHLILEIRQGVYHFLNDRLPECHKKVLAEVAVAEGIVQVVDVVVRKERHFDQLYCPDSKTGEIHFGQLKWIGGSTYVHSSPWSTIPFYLQAGLPPSLVTQISSGTMHPSPNKNEQNMSSGQD
jgi:hypothetical protein